MEKEQLIRIFDFLEEKENINKPFKWKLLNNEPFAEDDLDVKYDLNLEGANITSLPENLKVGGYLELYKTKFKPLPEGLEVVGDLSLMSTLITLLPKGLKVHKDLQIWNTELTKYSDDELRDMIKPGFIKGKIIRD